MSGRTKTEVRDKLRLLRRELDNGLHTAAHSAFGKPLTTGWHMVSPTVRRKRSLPA